MVANFVSPVTILAAFFNILSNSFDFRLEGTHIFLEYLCFCFYAF